MLIKICQRKGLFRAVGTALMGSMFLVLTCAAQMIGVPRITFDSRLGAGQNLFTTQGVNFDPAVGWATSAKAVSITYDGLTEIPLMNGTVDLHGRFLGASTGPGTVTGNFTSVNGVDADLIIRDDTGLLLAGVYGARHITGLLATGDGYSDSTFTVVGGSLAPLYNSVNGHGVMTNMLFDVFPLFSNMTFDSSFHGQIDGQLGPGSAVPEPATLGICSVFLLIAVGIRRVVKRNSV